jgi:hypothetical protein
LVDAYEIPISANDRVKAHPTRLMKDKRIRCAHQVVIINTLKSRNDIDQSPHELRREILIEEDPHSLSATMLPFSYLCCKGVDGGKILLLEAGMFLKDLRFSHAMREPPEYVGDGDAHAADALFAVPLVGLDGDSRVSHDHN